MSALELNVTAVSVEGRGILITGEPGIGKTSLALALIDRGAVLIGDDGVALKTGSGRLLALPPSRNTGVIEVRNVGLVTLATTHAPIALAIALSRDAERLPDGPQSASLHGIALPQVTLFPDTPALPLRAEYALKQYGLG